MKLLIVLLSVVISISSQQVTEARAQDIRNDLVDYSKLISESVTEKQFVNFCEVNVGKESAEDFCHEFNVNEAYKDGTITKEEALGFLKGSSE